MRIGGRRRPRETGEGKRQHRVTIRLNDAEMERLERYTSVTGSSPARVILAALGERDDAFERIAFARQVSAELMVTNRQLAGACTNLNQIAHGVNVDGLVDPGELAAVVAQIGQCQERIMAVVEEAFG